MWCFSTHRIRQQPIVYMSLNWTFNSSEPIRLLFLQTVPSRLVSFQFILKPDCAPMLQSRLSWTAEERAPPVTRDIPDVARTPQVKWPECLCHVKYVSGLSKQCIQYSGAKKRRSIFSMSQSLVKWVKTQTKCYVTMWRLYVFKWVYQGQL